MAEPASSHGTKLPIAARRHPLVAEVRRRLVRYANVTGRARIVIGVSGGPDSVALLVALLAIREQESSEVTPEPIIVHVNHHLRDDAAVDAVFVRSLGEQFCLPTIVRDVSPDEADANLAAAARAMRYDALTAVAREHDARLVAVAHHAEDQLETMLMALCRGTGLDGLSAMAWSRPLVSGDRPIMLVRPLLGSRKQECESLCAAAGIAWREDESNRDLSRRRNRLRHEVMPMLEHCWPDAPARAAMTAELLHEAAKLLDEKLLEHFGPAEQSQWPRASLAKLSPVLIAAGLRRAALDAMKYEDRATAEQLTQRTLLPAAEAIADTDSSPRRFALAHGMALDVRAKIVTLCVSG